MLKEILRGTIGAQPAQDTWAARRDGAGAGSDGSQLFCSE